MIAILILITIGVVALYVTRRRIHRTPPLSVKMRGLDFLFAPRKILGTDLVPPSDYELDAITIVWEKAVSMWHADVEERPPRIWLVTDKEEMTYYPSFGYHPWSQFQQYLGLPSEQQGLKSITLAEHNVIWVATYDRSKMIKTWDPKVSWIQSFIHEVGCHYIKYSDDSDYECIECEKALRESLEDWLDDLRRSI